uniref:Uncharacterized protein n=1 Tax=Rhizophora mucronata TaxID=61149 RepID=A0A2P2K3W4_RHIMU
MFVTGYLQGFCGEKQHLSPANEDGPVISCEVHAPDHREESRHVRLIDRWRERKVLPLNEGTLIYIEGGGEMVKETH